MPPERSSLRLGALAATLCSLAALGVVAGLVVGRSNPTSPIGGGVDVTGTVLHATTSLGGTGSGVVTPEQLALLAQCEADARVVDVAVAAARAEDPGRLPTTPTGWREGLLHSLPSAPFLPSWPASAPGAFGVSVAGAHAPRDTGDSVRPQDGDVLVVAGGRTYDFTVDPASACRPA